MNFLEAYFINRDELMALGNRHPETAHRIRQHAIWMALRREVVSRALRMLEERDGKASVGSVAVRVLTAIAPEEVAIKYALGASAAVAAHGTAVAASGGGGEDDPGTSVSVTTASSSGAAANDESFPGSPVMRRPPSPAARPGPESNPQFESFLGRRRLYTRKKNSLLLDGLSFDGVACGVNRLESLGTGPEDETYRVEATSKLQNRSDSSDLQARFEVLMSQLAAERKLAATRADEMQAQHAELVRSLHALRGEVRRLGGQREGAAGAENDETMVAAASSASDRKSPPSTAKMAKSFQWPFSSRDQDAMSA